jgi:outer membrane receptor protein involved in Fe transport
VRLRATRSRDIRAPNIPELFYRGNDGFLVATNPITGASGTINNAALANPNLEPEEADTWTAGIVLQPSWAWAEGLTASIDYFEIDLKGVIGTISAAAIINGYYLQGRQDYAQYFTFNAAAPAGFTRIDVPQLNLNSQKTSGVDLNIAYIVPASIPGVIGLNVMGSYLGEQQTLSPTGADLGDLADVTPKYRVTTNINYTLNSFSTTLTARYNSKFHWGPFFTGPDEEGYNPALPNNTNDNDFPSAIYYSLQGEYAVRDTGDQKVVLYAIVDNLLDKDPPEGAYTRIEGLGSPSNGAAGYSPYDVLGRFFSVGVRANF